MAAARRRWDPDALAATAAEQRRSLAHVALLFAGVEDEIAATFELMAARDATRRAELHAHATAARRYAEAERDAARHWLEFVPGQPGPDQQ